VRHDNLDVSVGFRTVRDATLAETAFTVNGTMLAAHNAHVTLPFANATKAIGLCGAGLHH